MLDRLKIGTHITLFPEWLIEWEYRAMDFDVGAEWIFSVNSESGEIEALESSKIVYPSFNFLIIHKRLIA